LQSIKNQIDEHKWYLSKKARKEINIKDASESWLNVIYYPIINEFEKLDIFEYFPFKNSAGLYVEIMTHKEQGGQRRYRNRKSNKELF
jgi:hypothetical protein